MLWPWVSRARLAAAEAALVAEHQARARLNGELSAERERYAQLVATVIELKREGFVPPTRPEQLESETANVPDLVLDAIGRRATPRSDLERELLRWASLEMRREDADPGKIAAAILRGGGPVDEEEEQR